MNPHVDLKQLAVRREPAGGESGPRRRHLVTRYLLPGGVLLGFLAVAGWAARDSLLPARPVTVVPVLSTRELVQAEGTPLFRAAGWIEPRPTPVLAAALAEGVVERLLVVEDQPIQKGEPVAELVKDDARLALDAALAELRLRQVEADQIIARIETDLYYLPFQIRSAEARERVAQQELESKKAARGAVPELSIQQAQGHFDAAAALLQELYARKKRLESEHAFLQRLRLAEPKTPLDPGRPLTDNEVNYRMALARVQQAQVVVDNARLRLERMTVRAPITGRVLALVARPGTRLMGQAAVGHQEASTVVTLYDPDSLQVRADVPLENVPQVQPGQKVRIETAAVPGGHIDGEVLFGTALAEIQKNTLQVKVALKACPPHLKPDMLVQATFLAPRTEEETTAQLRLLIPRQLVQADGAGPQVWVADQAAGVARLRPIRLGSPRGDLVEVEGLDPSDKLIVSGREGLSEGQRIAVTGEDATLGITHRAGGKAPKMSRLPEGKH
jgi:HlyD family secretion protein